MPGNVCNRRNTSQHRWQALQWHERTRTHRLHRHPGSAFRAGNLTPHDGGHNLHVWDIFFRRRSRLRWKAKAPGHRSPLLLLLSLLLEIHFEFNSSSLRAHFAFTLMPLRCHFDFTFISIQFLFDFASSSIQFHFHFTLMSFQFHFDFTATSLRCHFDFPAVSLRCHFDSTEVSLWFHFDSTPTSLRSHPQPPIYVSTKISAPHTPNYAILWKSIHFL